MAEAIAAVGITASIIQLLDAVSKLKSAFDTFRDAPTDLARLVKFVSLSSRHLARLKNDLSSDDALDGDLLSECIEHVDEALLAVSTVSQALSRTLQRSKKLESLKYVFKTDEVKKACRYLERAQDMMDRVERLADRIQRQKQKDILDKVNNKVERLMTYAEINSVTTCAAQYGDHAPDLQRLSRNIGKQIRVRHKGFTSGKEADQRGTFRVALPLWLWSTHYEFAFQRHCSLTTFSMRSYRVHLWKSEVIRVIWRDDVSAVRSFMEAGVITPYDTIHSPGSFWDGWSILDYVIDFGVVKVFDLLLGLQVGARRRDYCELVSRNTLLAVQNSLWTWGTDRWHGSRAAKTFFELLDAVEPEDDEEVDDFVDCMDASPFWCRDDLVRLMRVQPQLGQVAAGIIEPCLEYRAFQAMCAHTPSEFDAALDGKLSRQDAFRICNQNQAITGRRLLDFVFRCSEIRWPGWSGILGDLFEFESTMDAPKIRTKNSTYIWSPHTLAGYWQRWFDFVQKCGANLEHYAMIERLRLQSLQEYPACQEGLVHYYYPAPSDGAYLARLVGFTCGSEPSDWKEYWAPYDWEYEWAGAFWYWVENPENFMPGAYIEALYEYGSDE
jgi:hypothetical protein